MSTNTARIAFCLITGCSFVDSGYAAGSVADAARAPPRSVRVFAERAELCMHFAGEEGYEARRRAEINRAYKKYRCSALSADKIKLLNAYRTNSPVTTAINAIETE